MILELITNTVLTILVAGNIGVISLPSGSVSVIGGADGPTSVFLAGKLIEDTDNLMLQTEEVSEEEISLLPLEVTLKAVSFDGGLLTVMIDNQSGADYYYGKEYALQRRSGDNWIDVEPSEPYGWPKISLMVKDLETAYEVYDLTVFGTLTAGTYKLVKNDLESEFTLVEKEN